MTEKWTPGPWEVTIGQEYSQADRLMFKYNEIARINDDLVTALEKIAAIPYSLKDRERGQINRIAMTALTRAKG